MYISGGGVRGGERRKRGLLKKNSGGGAMLVLTQSERKLFTTLGQRRLGTIISDTKKMQSLWQKRGSRGNRLHPSSVPMENRWGITDAGGRKLSDVEVPVIQRLLAGEKRLSKTLFLVLRLRKKGIGERSDVPTQEKTVHAPREEI